MATTTEPELALRSPFLPHGGHGRRTSAAAAAAWALLAIAVPLLLLLLVLASSSGSSSSPTAAAFFRDTLRGISSRMHRCSSSSSSSNVVELTLLAGAQEKGAVCLDGSLPAYHLQRGSGSGSHNWVIHLQGGAWCDTVESCVERTKTVLGSSDLMEPMLFEGILSNDPKENPDFHNWNRAYIRYCDGASYSGDSQYEDENNGIKLFFRGQRIWEAIIDELMQKGLAHSKQAILTGCSAGGLGALLHCNQFREMIPKETSLKCLADAGFFLDIEDLSGHKTQWSRYNGVVHLQNVTKVLPKDCLAEKDPARCFFPAEVIKSVKVPTFILNSAYDSWQIPNILAPNRSLPDNSWQDCKSDLRKCSSTQLQVVQGLREQLLKDLKAVEGNKELGWFIDSCYTHCQVSENDISWNAPKSTRLGNKTIAEAFGNWYFGRSSSEREIDCEYPCNPTCNHQ
ncbi:hypothetical protein ACP4OV_019341 [Aristida adscensionis]